MQYSRQSVALAQRRMSFLEDASLVVDGYTGPKTNAALGGRAIEDVWPDGLMLDMWGDPDWSSYARYIGIPMVSTSPIKGVQGEFLPEGIVVHHTAGPEGREHANVAFLKDGRSDVSGPLYVMVVSRDATADAITNGRSHNAGKGDSAVLRHLQMGFPAGEVAPQKDIINGNTSFYGFVLDHSGNPGEPVPIAALKTLARGVGMVTDAWCWDPLVRVLGHKEWTRRKSDPVFDMDDFRAMVAGRKAPTLPPPANLDFGCPHCGALLSVVERG